MLTTCVRFWMKIIYAINGIKYNKEDGTVSIHLRDLGEQVGDSCQRQWNRYSG